MRMTPCLTAIAMALAASPAAAQSEAELERLLANVREPAELVGAAAGIVEQGEIVVRAASGVRVSGGEDAVTIKDNWHIGSLTKSVTATLIATLVDDDTLRWDTTIGETWPDADAAWHDVTVSDLLTHQSGAAGNFPMHHFLQPDPPTVKEISAWRTALVAEASSAPPPGERGSFAYSNLGYTIAGAMAEAATGQPWEALASTRVLGPLGIAHGFGPPTGEHAPLGHRNAGADNIPVSPAIERADNPAFMRPAGGLHMPLDGLLAWAQFHLGDGSTLLSPESFARLHAPGVAMNERQAYAGGWIVDTSGGGFGAGPLVWHAGSNTMWYALVLLFPEQGGAIVFTSNDGDLPRAEAAFVRAGAMIAKKRGWTSE